MSGSANLPQTPGSWLKYWIGLLLSLPLIFHSFLGPGFEHALEGIEDFLHFKEHPLPVLVGFALPIVPLLFRYLSQLLSQTQKIQEEVNKCSVLYKEFAFTLAQIQTALADRTIALIHLETDPDVFSNFTGDFYAINAPLTWERHYLKMPVDPIQVHIDRYSNPTFNIAHYCFPIFSYLSDETLCDWCERLLRVLLHFRHRVMSKYPPRKAAHIFGRLQFWVPRKSTTGQYLKDDHPATMTAFAGVRRSTKQVIFFHSSTMFSTISDLPDIAFLIHNDDFHKRIVLACCDFSGGRHALTLDQFISELQSNLSEEIVKTIQAETN
jgi:hypothetical protein